MGVFKWLRRERVTVSRTRDIHITPTEDDVQTAKSMGTIRTEQYKRDLAEFQARRSAGKNDIEDMAFKKKCGRHSLPVSCTSCTSDLDNTFNYEKKSASKYKEKRKRSKSASNEDIYEALPSIQFVFQNQVFMPGNVFTSGTYSEPHKNRRNSKKANGTSSDRTLFTQKHIDFNDDQEQLSPSFNKNNSLPFDVNKFLEGAKSDEEEVDGFSADLKTSSPSSASSNDDSCREKLVEVMSELRSFDQWADEQLKGNSMNNTAKSEDNKSDTSTYGLPVVTTSDLDVSVDKDRNWNNGKWGSVPVQIKKLTDVTFEQVKKRLNVEINILRKCRHPNVILLMGLYADIHRNIYIICESCEDSLFNILHVQGKIISIQSAVRYTLDISNALVFLRMRGYIHSELTSHSVMLTAQDVAKLSDFEPCVKVIRDCDGEGRSFELYSPQPQYVNIGDTIDSTLDCQPLLSTHASSVYLNTEASSKQYENYRNSVYYRWHAPELFVPDGSGLVYPCSKSDVYALSLVLWETCNAEIPFKNLSYEDVKDQYHIWNAGIRLSSDGTYPGCMLQLLQRGLTLTRQRPSLDEFTKALAVTKQKLDSMEYIFIPTRLHKPRCGFSSSTSPTISECLSPITDIVINKSQSPNNDIIIHKAVVHNQLYSSTSEKETKSDASALYETNRTYAKTCFIPEDTQTEYNDFYGSWTTPISKVKAKIKEIETPGLHRTDSTEYCSILSPNYSYYVDKSGPEKSATKLSRSFTPKSYKPLHIKVPEYNLDCIKSLSKEQTTQNSSEKSSYNFDIKNYSLPSTPIARSNKLRKNAWLSGEISLSERTDRKTDKSAELLTQVAVDMKAKSTPEPPKAHSLVSDSLEKDGNSESSYKQFDSDRPTPETLDNTQDIFPRLTRSSEAPADASTESVEQSWSYKTSSLSSPRRDGVERESGVEPEEGVNGEGVEGVSVRPLVAIHERWIMEARRKSGRSMSLPEDRSRPQMPAVKPASHCVDTFQKSFPQLNTKIGTNKFFRGLNTMSTTCTMQSGKIGGQSEQFCQARDNIAKSIDFASRNAEGRQFNTRTWRKDYEKTDKGVNSETAEQIATSNQATDTGNIEDFIRELIRTEFHHLLQEIDDKVSEKRDQILKKGVENIVGALKNEERREPIKSYSKIKINGNNKPLLQISFSHTGENSLKVFDNCVNVTVSDGSQNNGNSKEKDKLSQSLDEATGDEGNANSLKRCQGFSAIQDARSTEDLYIDDDLSTHMQENFGGRVKLIPLHGSVHEMICDREDDCCLNKVKQENFCDIIYFKCDNSDTESRDAIDGAEDKLYYKHRISYVHESLQRIFPRDKKVRRLARPKSEVIFRRLCDTKILSNSSPSLFTGDSDAVEVNIENVLCYQDSSSEECLRQADGDNYEFEQLESEIEAELSGSTMYHSSQCLPKISEESLSVIAEEASD